MEGQKEICQRQAQILELASKIAGCCIAPYAAGSNPNHEALLRTGYMQYHETVFTRSDGCRACVTGELS